MDELFDAFEEDQQLSTEELASLKKTPVKANPAKRAREVSENATPTPSKQPKMTVEKEDLGKMIVTKVETTDKESVKQERAATGTTEKNLIHFSVLPADYKPLPDLPADYKPAKEYPFKLDPFQQKAVDYIEKGESVLVSAHTSAGKTAVAEYAIAKSLRDKQRVIYTSPIKALSNQKYRDLEQEFTDVGLMTGDITINPNATVLIMTTEILRSMLYRGSEVMREVAWVIYDEIHYMRDKERGVVWEESIILLPHKVRFVFLSATIPNSKQFAQWICQIHHQACHVIYTDYRPTPLQHYLFPAGGSGLHLVVDEKGKFREDNFQKAIASLVGTDDDNDAGDENGSGKKKSKKNRSSAKQVGSDVFRIVKLIMEREYDPVIIFSFSKRECEAYALLMSKLDFNTAEEKKMVEEIFNNAMDSLSEDDRKLPQVDSILPLLKRGIGIHHGGLLPILKEVIEILFGESLLKCLFATETFSMGLNMPAKTVVFTQCRKFDGKEQRWITSGEYIQMSGRAGRRSTDARGIVIQMLSEKIEPQIAKNILYGQADPLFSTFHLKYNMLLNLLRVEDANPEYMIKQSFHQFQNEQTAPGLEEKIVELRQQQQEIQVVGEEVVEEYYHLSNKCQKLRQQIQKTINSPAYATPFLNPGRLVLINDHQNKWDWGVIVNYESVSQPESDDQQIQLHVLLNCVAEKSSTKATSKALPKPMSLASVGKAECEMKVCPVPLQCVEKMSSIRVYLPKVLASSDSRQAVGKSLKEVLRRFPDSLPLLDPVKDMNIQDDEFMKQCKKLSDAEVKLKAHDFDKASDKDTRFALFNEKMELDMQIRHLEREINQSKSLVLRDDLRRRKRILRRLKFTNEDNVIELKGRTACELSTADELVLTQLIFHGVFNDLSVDECVALLSCLIHTEKKKDEDTKPPLNERLHAPIRQLHEIARTIAKVCQEANLDIDVDDYTNQFNPGLVDLVMAWCQGAKFRQICKMSKTFEGTIIRCIRRLEELLRQLTLAAHAMGNTELEAKFAEGGKKIKRDIVFAASLYL